MSARDWTPAPWTFSSHATGVHIGSDAVQHTLIDTSYPGPSKLSRADARRIVAAINATADFTTEGLEEIAAKGLTLQLALRATWMAESEKLTSFEGMKQFLADAGATIKAEDEDDTYPLSRAD